MIGSTRAGNCGRNTYSDSGSIGPVVTAADRVGGAHVGTPVTVPVAPGYTFALSASLYQSHAPWLTETFVDLEFTGLAERYRPVSGSARVPVSVAGQLPGSRCSASRPALPARRCRRDHYRPTAARRRPA